jgi:hypothetical protein
VLSSFHFYFQLQSKWKDDAATARKSLANEIKESEARAKEHAEQVRAMREEFEAAETARRREVSCSEQSS